MSDLITRAIFDGLEVRAVNEEKRSAQFVAATERGVLTYMGREHLQMKGLNLKRYAKNPVVLDSHNREGLAAIIGRAAVEVDKERGLLLADITFAETASGEQAWQLVKGGFCRALSVGFIPDAKSTRELEPGEEEGDFVGPCRIIGKWELFEISCVPVPADADAVRRATVAAMDEAGGIQMAKKEEAPAAPVVPQVVPPVVVQAITPAQPAPTVAATDKPAVVTADDGVARLQADELRKRQILLITPRGCEALADRLIVEGKPIEEARAAFLGELARREGPVGTPEPVAPQSTGKKLSEVSDADLAKGITR